MRTDFIIVGISIGLIDDKSIILDEILGQILTLEIIFNYFQFEKNIEYLSIILLCLVNFRIFENSITGSPKQLNAKAKATISYYVYLIRNFSAHMSKFQVMHCKKRVFKIWKENKRDLFFWFELFRSQLI